VSYSAPTSVCVAMFSVPESQEVVGGCTHRKQWNGAPKNTNRRHFIPRLDIMDIKNK